jgi:DnaJ-domain-containing protein 1
MFIRQNLKNPPALGPLLKEITDKKLKNQIIRDAYLMAYIDEEMHPKESDTLRTIANIFKLSEEQVELISRWAAKGQDWRKEGYELSIIE